jgi:hypothetical protein
MTVIQGTFRLSARPPVRYPSHRRIPRLVPLRGLAREMNPVDE